MKLLAAILTAALLATPAAGAGEASADYLMWQLPDSGISLPVYVYQGGQQVAYIPSTSLQFFAGEYEKNATKGTWDLYYREGSA